MWLTPNYVIRGILNNEIYAVHTEGGFNSIFRKMVEKANINILFNKEVMVRKRKDVRQGTSFLACGQQRWQVLSHYPIWRRTFGIWFPNLVRTNEVSKRTIFKQHYKTFRDFTERTSMQIDTEDFDLLSSQRYRSVTGSLVNVYNETFRKASTEIYLYNIKRDPWINDVTLSTDAWAEKNVRTLPSNVSSICVFTIASCNQWHKWLLWIIPIWQVPHKRSRSEDKESVCAHLWQQNRCCDWRRSAAQHLQPFQGLGGWRGWNCSYISSQVIRRCRICTRMVSFRYFPQWDIARIANGAHWKLLRMQGKYGMWFTGGGALWDSTKGCMEYARLLVNLI